MTLTSMHWQNLGSLILKLRLKSFTHFILVMMSSGIAVGSAFAVEPADNPAWYVGKYYNPTNPASPTGFTIGYKLYRTIGCPGKELLGIPCVVPPPPVEAVQANSAPVNSVPVNKAVPVATQPEAAPVVTVAQQPASIVNVLASNSIYFDFDKSLIKPEYRETLKKNYEALKSLPRTTLLRLEGNCDERGSAEYNLALGQRRADAVRTALVLLGFPEAQIQTVSWGKEKPRCTEHNEQCWSQNRRVDFIVK